MDLDLTLNIDFVSASDSAGVAGSSTGDYISILLFIIAGLSLFIIAAFACLRLHNVVFATPNGQHLINNSKTNTSKLLIFLGLLATLCLCLLAFNLAQSAIALDASQLETPGTINAYVDEETGEIAIEDGWLTNNSDAILDIATSSALATGTSADTLKLATFQTDGLETTIFKGNPDASAYTVTDCTPLEMGATSTLEFALTGLSADQAKSLINNASITLTLSLKDVTPIYTVTFDTQGHSTAPDPIEVKHGHTITKPADPAPEGTFTFRAWYKESECTNEWNFASDTVTDNITLYAGWDSPEYFKAAKDASNNLLIYYGPSCPDPAYTSDYGTIPCASATWPWASDATSIISVTIHPSTATFTGLQTCQDMFKSFENCVSWQGFENLDTRNVTNMSYMFAFASSSVGSSFNAVPDTSTWDTAKVTNFTGMFSSYGYSCNNLSLVPNVSNFDTSKATTFAQMFSGYAINSHVLDKIPDVSNWQTPELTSLDSCFSRYGASSTVLTDVVDVSNWDTSHVTNFDGVFDCYAQASPNINKVPNVSSWDTSSATSMKGTFAYYGAYSTVLSLVPDLSAWDTTQVTTFETMFCAYGKNSTQLDGVSIDLSSFTVSTANTDEMFSYGVAIKSYIFSNKWTKNFDGTSTLQYAPPYTDGTNHYASFADMDTARNALTGTDTITFTKE